MRLGFWLVLLVCAMGLTLSIAVAQTQVPDAGVPQTVGEAEDKLDGGDGQEVQLAVQLVRAIVDAARHKNWRVVVGLVLSLLVYALRQLAVKKAPWPKVRAWLATDRGGVALLVATSMAASLSTLLMSGRKIGLDDVVGCLGNGLIAAGGYSVVKKLWAPTQPPKTVIAAGPAEG